MVGCQHCVELRSVEWAQRSSPSIECLFGKQDREMVKWDVPSLLNRVAIKKNKSTLMRSHNTMAPTISISTGTKKNRDELIALES